MDIMLAILFVFFLFLLYQSTYIYIYMLSAFDVKSHKADAFVINTMLTYITKNCNQQRLSKRTESQGK